MLHHQSKNRKNNIIINIIQTPVGYSVLEGEDLLNKPALTERSSYIHPTINTIANSATNIATSNNVMSNNPNSNTNNLVLNSTGLLANTSLTVTVPAPTRQKNSSIAQQQAAKRQNIIIPLSPHNLSSVPIGGSLGNLKPHINGCSITTQQSKILNINRNKLISIQPRNLPQSSKWFDINSIHQIEKKMLSEWFKVKKGTSSNSNNPSAKQLQIQSKNQQFYKKARNHIIQLSQQGYVSATRARKGLVGDVCIILRIHAFLQQWGIINQTQNQIPNVQQQRYLLFKENQQQKILSQYEKKYPAKVIGGGGSIGNSRPEDTETLRKATKKYRPLCNFCSQRCGIVWFQHRRNLNSKEISNIMKNVNSKNPPLSPSQYQIILCIKCYSEGNFPIILSAADFNKVSIQQKLSQRSRKKKDKQRAGQAATDTTIQTQWNNEEIAKLLDLIQQHGQNWQDIAKQMKNRTAEEVVQCFLRLPLKQISKIKFQYDAEQFVKENNDQLANDFSTNIYTNPYFESHSEPQVSQNQTNPNQQFQFQTNQLSHIQKREYQNLVDQLVKLYVKKIQLKLQQLQQWQINVQRAKKDVQEGRKSVVVEKLRNSVSGGIYSTASHIK